MEIVDCYRVLGLRMGASYEDIKASYRRLARIYHPDSNPDNQQQAKEKFIQLTDAYRRLINVVQPPASDKDSPTVNLKQDRQAAPPKPAQVKVSVKSKAPPLQDSPELSPTDRKLKREAYGQLQQMLKEQRFPRAIALVEGLAQRLPEDIEVRQWQAITYQRFARYLIQNRQGEKARIYLKKALRTDPHNKSLWQEVNRDFQRLEQLELY
ncbi:MAG: J domain-containing protein [Oscillatoriophycideae cyanobacterium NC_groundwater_1537_Pr4_S-0.65um_50_18]|nr:J domain-containing protein [Oscillatoriophycideae cyanobacterium NC_groundwater_1537_Pr4_S-0.65um_50_18]